MWTKLVTKGHMSVDLSFLLRSLLTEHKIRIDSAGIQEYFQFEAKPHPPMKPMAYVQGGLGSLMM